MQGASKFYVKTTDATVYGWTENSQRPSCPGSVQLTSSSKMIGIGGQTLLQPALTTSCDPLPTNGDNFASDIDVLGMLQRMIDAGLATRTDAPFS
jgi:hypothetical protein